jgi:hypothetical protein
MFVAYAIVPVTEITDADFSKPITLSDVHIATYNPMSGTFHDAAHVTNLTVNPSDGHFYSGAYGYSPDDICGLNISHYQGHIIQKKGTVQ